MRRTPHPAATREPSTKENPLNGNESEPRSVADPNPPADETDIYAVLAKEYRIDKSTISILKAKRVFEQLSAQEIRIMMECYVTTFGQIIAQRLICYAPEDVRPWLEEVAPRVATLGRVCHDLQLRFAFDMIIREYEIIRCQKEHFDSLIESLYDLIASAKERRNFLFAYPQYFSLHPVRVRAFAGRGFKLSTMKGDVPFFWQQLKSFAGYTKEELETARRTHEETLEAQLRLESALAVEQPQGGHQSASSVSDHPNPERSVAPKRLSATIGRKTQLELDDVVPYGKPVFFTQSTHLHPRPRKSLLQEPPVHEHQLLLFPSSTSIRQEQERAARPLEHQMNASATVLPANAEEKTANQQKAAARLAEEAKAEMEADQYFYSLKMTPGMKNRSIARLHRLFGSIHEGVSWIKRMKELGWHDAHFLQLFQATSCKVLRTPSEEFPAWMTFFREQADVSIEAAARILIDNDYLLKLGIQECGARLAAACGDGGMEEKRTILLQSPHVLRMRPETLQEVWRNRLAKENGANADSSRKKTRGSAIGSAEMADIAAPRPKAPPLSGPKDAFLVNEWKLPAVDAHFTAFPALARQSPDTLYESIRLIAKHLNLRNSSLTTALKQGIASTVPFAPLLKALDLRSRDERSHEHTWYDGFDLEQMTQELAVSVHRFAAPHPEEDTVESSDLLADALAELNKWMSSRLTDEQAEGERDDGQQEERSSTAGKRFLAKHPHLLALHRQPLLVVYGMVRSFGLREHFVKLNLLQKGPELARHLAPLFLHPQAILLIVNRQRQLAVDAISNHSLDSTMLDPCIDWRRLLIPLRELEWRYAFLGQEKESLRSADKAALPVIDALFHPARRVFIQAVSKYARA